MEYKYHIYIDGMEQREPIIIKESHNNDERAINHGKILRQANFSFTQVIVYSGNTAISY